jgi:heterodisulfide reductase subunit C
MTIPFFQSSIIPLFLLTVRFAMADIDLSKSDPKFRKQLASRPGGEKVMACFTCRTCTASCPVSAVNNRFNPYRIIRMALYGLKDEVLRSDFIWLCSSCYACQERCPQGVSITDFMTLLKNMAVEEGHAPAGIRAQRDLVKGQGRIYAIDEFDNKKRNKVDLPSLPTTCEVVKVLFPES